MTALRPLLFVLALVLSGQALAAVHAHDGGEPVVCETCVLADRADDAGEPPVALVSAVPLPEPVARAFAAGTAIVPAVTAHPPGRAPPLAG